MDPIGKLRSGGSSLLFDSTATFEAKTCQGVNGELVETEASRCLELNAKVETNLLTFQQFWC